MRNSRKAFALIETLAVVALLGITAALGTIPVNSLKNSMNQSKANSIAQEIFMLAQDNMAKLNTSGNAEIIYPEVDEENDQEKGIYLLNEWPINYEEDEPQLYYMTINSDSDMVEKIIPTGSFDEDIRNNSWVIEYEPYSCTVFAVFYGTTENNYEFYDVANDLRPSKKARLNYHTENDKDYYVGYYGHGDSVDVEVSDINKTGNLVARINVDNGEVLSADFSVKLPKKFAEDEVDVLMEVTFVGKTSGAKMTVKRILEGPGEKRSFKLILDELDDHTFEKNFISGYENEDGSITLIGEKVGTTDFIRGEDLDIYLTASAINNNSLAPSTAANKIVNSLFADVKQSPLGGNRYTAEVDNGRQLQNLNNARNDNFVINEVEQGSDIDFNGKYKQEYGDRPFEPIDNPNIYNYDGQNHNIKNLNVENEEGSNKGAGLFEEFGKNKPTELKDLTFTIENLKLVDTKIDGQNGNAGALIGNAGDNVFISNVGVHLEKNYSGAYDNPYITGYNAGGLVGDAGKDVHVKDSYAATTISSTNYTGGLIGNAGNNLHTEHSYSDCYLGGWTVGGIAGHAPAAHVDICYTAGFLYEGVTNAGGMIPNTIAKANNGYSALDISNASGDKYSTFVSATTIDPKESVTYVSGLGEVSNATGTLAKSATEMADKEKTLAIVKIADTYAISNTTSYAYNLVGKMDGSYPYPVFKNIPHYGDWTKGSDGGTGFFYWEKVVYGNGSNETVKYGYYIIDDLGNVTDKLNYSYDDDGDITDYGYGYFWDKKNDETKVNNLGLIQTNGQVYWDLTSLHIVTAHTIDSIRETLEDPNSGELEHAVENDDVAEDIIKYLGDKGTNVNVHAYQTCGTVTTPLSPYIYLVGDVTSTTVMLKPAGSSPVSYTFNPFFAKCVVKGGKDKFTFGSDSKPFEVRSLEQLQFINWNSWRLNCYALSSYNLDQVHIEDHIDPLVAVCKHFPYLSHVSKFTDTINKGVSENNNNYVFKQTHNIDGRSHKISQKWTNEIVPGTYMAIATSDYMGIPGLYTYVAAWFGGTYDGQSYEIKNVDMITNRYTVGLFGTTCGAKIKNVILHKETPSLLDNVDVNNFDYESLMNLLNNGVSNFSGITRVANDPGDYYMGALVGLALDFDDGEGYIDNCSVSGYTIMDLPNDEATSNKSSFVGGLVGASSVPITNCSADTKILVATDRWYGHEHIGGIAGTVCEGNETNPSVEDCYSGGSIFLINTYDANWNYFIGGIAGGNRKAQVTNINGSSQKEANNIYIKNCYTYMYLPSHSEVYTLTHIIKNPMDRFRTSALYATLSDVQGVTCTIDNCYNYKNLTKSSNNIISNLVKENEQNYVYKNNNSYNYLQMIQNKGSHSVTAANTHMSSTTGLNVGKAYSWEPKVQHCKTKEWLHYGDWPVGYTVTLSKNCNDSNLKDYTLLVGIGTTASEMKVPQVETEMVRQGYTFKGYTYGETALGPTLVCNTKGEFVSGNHLMPVGKWIEDKNITVKAWWVAKEYKISYADSKSSFGSMTNPNANKYTTYSIVSDIKLEQPTKVGYDFAGWEYKDPTTGKTVVSMDVTIKASSSAVLNTSNGNIADITFTAKWTPKTYTITFEGISGANFTVTKNNKNVTVSNNKVNFTIEDTISISSATKSGKSFIGWKEKGKVIPEATKSISKGTTDRTFVACWAEFFINFHSEHFEGQKNEPSYVYVNDNGSKVLEGYSTISTNEDGVTKAKINNNTVSYKVLDTREGIPVLSSFILTGWYDSNHNLVINSDGTINNSNQSGTIDLYAGWEIEYEDIYVLDNSFDFTNYKSTDKFVFASTNTVGATTILTYEDTGRGLTKYHYFKPFNYVSVVKDLNGIIYLDNVLSKYQVNYDSGNLKMGELYFCYSTDVIGNYRGGWLSSDSRDSSYRFVVDKYNNNWLYGHNDIFGCRKNNSIGFCVSDNKYFGISRYSDYFKDNGIYVYKLEHNIKVNTIENAKSN